jgi:hypothetical protein
VFGRLAADQATLLGPVDQSGHAGFVDPEKSCQLKHPGASVAEHAEQAELWDREVVGARGIGEYGLHRKGQLYQSVHECRAGGRGIVGHD